MQSFDEFWNSISEDDFLAIAEKASNAMEKVKNDTENPEYLLGNQIAVMSTSLTKSLLSRYHEWLSEQL